MPQWTALMRDHHPGYISWEQFERNQRRLEENAHMKGTIARKAAPGGRGLLAGLLRCARCGRMLHVVYDRAGYARYQCREGNRTQAAPRCIGFGTRRPDETVSAAILTVVQGQALQAAIEAGDLAEQQDVDQHRALALELHAQQHVNPWHFELIRGPVDVHQQSAVRKRPLDRCDAQRDSPVVLVVERLGRLRHKGASLLPIRVNEAAVKAREHREWLSGQVLDGRGQPAGDRQRELVGSLFDRSALGPRPIGTGSHSRRLSATAMGAREEQGQLAQLRIDEEGFRRPLWWHRVPPFQRETFRHEARPWSIGASRSRPRGGHRRCLTRMRGHGRGPPRRLPRRQER
jgi:hypothetical protein